LTSRLNILENNKDIIEDTSSEDKSSINIEDNIFKELKEHNESLKSELDIKIKLALEEQKSIFNNEYKKLKEEKDKNTLEYLYKGFSIYDDSNIEWKVIAGSFTYKNFKMLYEFNESIKRDKKVNHRIP
jgi:hypothetical protein